MTIWDRIVTLLGEAQDRTLGALMEAISARRRNRDAAVFSVALIALSAKLAKADGVVTDDEVVAFRAFFSFPEEQADRVRTIYHLAQEDVAGFDSYARQVGRLYEQDVDVLEDVLDCLFFIALADGVMHPREMELLELASAAFKLDKAAWRRVKAAHLGADKEDPYAILGVEPDVTDDALKKAYLTLVKNHHPDALMARGVPEDLIRISEHRMAAINDAYERALAERAA